MMSNPAPSKPALIISLEKSWLRHTSTQQSGGDDVNTGACWQKHAGTEVTASSQGL
jgi:hypothetical protein